MTQARDDEREVACLVVRFFHCLDDHDGAGAAGLLASDVEWMTQRYGTLRGAAAAVANIAGRLKGTVSRHCATNIVVEWAGGEALARAYVIIFAIDGADTPPKLPVAMDLPRALLDFRFRAVRQADGWRIAALSSDLVFVATSPRAQL